jgi:hypothetical protein
MTFDTLFLQPLWDMMGRMESFIPTLFVALVILIVGSLVAHVVHKLLNQLLKVISFDKIVTKLGLTAVLKNGGIDHKPSDLVSMLVYLVLMFVVTVMTIKAFGVTIASELIDTLIAYIPHVISGVVVLIVGMLLARFVSALVYLGAKNTDMPAPHVLSRLTKLAIMIYVTIIFLKEIGFVSLFDGVNYTIFIAGIIFALALSFGLAGKEVASHYLDVFDTKKHHPSK